MIDFYRAAKAEGIKPILGCEVYVAPQSRFDKEVGTREEQILSSRFTCGK